ncbi:MAG: complex I subunit 1/NuoH family protein [Myxococcales bacterium]
MASPLNANSNSPDSRIHAAPVQTPGISLEVPSVATPMARFSANDFGSSSPPREAYDKHLFGSIFGWGAFAGFLLVLSWVFLALVRAFAELDSRPFGTFQGIGNIVALDLIFVMITATLLTMAERKWSALMQDRVGPNRARLPIPGLRDMPLKGLPHIPADVLKMLFKEDFLPEGAVANKLLFNLAPLLAFGPAFCLFAVVPFGPPVEFAGKVIQLQIAHLDWGILYVFALASLAVFGTALAGWTSNNKLALLGGLRASAQLVSYEVTLGLTLVGTFIVFGSLRLDEMALLQGASDQLLHAVMRLRGSIAATPADDSLVWGFLPGWGALFQPLGMILFLVAAMAEIKRAPFDTPEGDSEIIGYYLEYSGLKSGLFLIAEFAEVVVISGIVTAIFLGAYHIPWIEPWLVRQFNGVLGFAGTSWLAVLQVFSSILKVLFLIWVQFLARWAFPRFRYDQIMRLGWKMMLPVSLANVVVTAGVFLWGGREGLALLGVVEWIAILAFIALSAATQAETAGHVPSVTTASHGTPAIAHGTPAVPATGSAH